MTLDLRIAARPEVLVDALAERLAVPGDDPFAPDLVVVPNAGMREWTQTHLIERLGVLAGVEFVFPAELTRRSIGLPDHAEDPWRPERLAWHVLGLMVEGTDLGRTPWEWPPPRPWAVARRVADLLERTASQRPDLAATWLAERGDAGLGAAHGWQPAMWRALRERDGVPTPAELLLAALDGVPAGHGAAVGAGAGAAALPARLSVLGLSSLTAPFASVLVHVARDRDVLVLATVASEAAVREALAARAPGDAAGPQVLLAAPPRASDVRLDAHPLLASWGRPALEAATMLARLPGEPTLLDHPHDGAGVDGAGVDGASQLARLQQEVRGAVPVVPRGLDRERDGDGSVQVHACHGLARQLEVLRDALLHAMEADPTLEPRDIAVLCADLESVAPLAGPILGADVGGRHLPVLVTDRAASTVPPVQAALDAALSLATSRLERDTVLTFLSMPVVAAALGLDADDLDLLERLADDLDVRWGRDAGHRERWGYPHGVAVGTWREALDRLLAGLMMDADGGLVGGIAPAQGLGMQDLGRVGRLADALATVAHLTTFDASGARPMADWAAPLRWTVDTLLRPRRSVDAATHAYATQAAQVREVVDALVADAEAARVTFPVDVREVRAALEDRMGGGGSRARLRTGHVSVASLAPLRGVPFRLIAVVGAGDALLGARGADDDDVLAREPRLGERDASGERRAALLDAVLSARDTLIVTCDGQDVRSGERLDLPTVIEELLDALPPAGAPDGGGGGGGGGGGEGAPLVVRHPRHLADRRNLTVGPGSVARVDRERPWTFSPSALRALAAIEAAATTDVRPAAGAGVLTATTAAPRWTTVPLPALPAAPVQLRIEDVVDALARPASTLLRERLGVRLPRERASDPRTIELWVDDPLAQWALGQDLLAHLMVGGSVDGWIATRPARGGVPPGRLGRAQLGQIADEVVALHDEAGRPVTTPSAASPAHERPGTLVALLPVGIDLDLPDAPHGVRRVRLVGGVRHVDGDVIDVRYSRDHRRHLVGAAVGLLAATAGVSAGGVSGARVVRRAPSGSRDPAPIRHGLAVQGDDGVERTAAARDALTRLVDLALRVRTGPAALLPRAAWSIDATTDLTVAPSGGFADDVKKDLEDVAFRVVVGAGSLAELAQQDDGPLEEGLPAAPTPLQRWSLALREPLEQPFALALDGALAPEAAADADADAAEDGDA